MGGTINGDIYTRYRQAVEQLGQGMGRWQALRAAATTASPDPTPVAAAERWRSAGVQIDDQVARQLIATQADEEVDNTDGGDPGEVDPAAPDPAADPAADPKGDGSGVGMSPAPTMPNDPPTGPPMGPTDPSPLAPTPDPVTPVAVLPSEPTTPSPMAPPPAAPTPIPSPPVVSVSAIDALSSLVRAQNAANDPVAQYKRHMFSAIDTDRDGSVGTGELSAAVNAGGGTAEAVAALTAQLDPAATGMVTMQQFVDNLPAPTFQGIDLGFGSPWTGPGTTAGEAVAALYSNPLPAQQTERPAATPPGNSILSPFDFNRNAALDLHELMFAVQRGGGTAESGAALFNQLDPLGTGEVTQQQFIDGNVAVMGSMLGFDGGGSSAIVDPNVQSGLVSLNAALSVANAPTARATRDLFAGMDTNNDGMLVSDDIMQAVTAAGGSAESAEALYAQLDPENTGGITMDQFMDNLPPLDADNNGVVSVRAALPPQPAPTDPVTVQAGMPLPMSSDMLSVLLQLQNNGFMS